MSNQRFSPEFKDEAVRQIVDRGYSVAEVSERLGAACANLHARRQAALSTGVNSVPTICTDRYKKALTNH